MTNQLARLLAEQAHYYRERAGEYDDWWFRRGRYDHGPETNARWFADAAEVARGPGALRSGRRRPGARVWDRPLDTAAGPSRRQRDRDRRIPGGTRTGPGPRG